jgi:hypothetical protein
MSRNCPKNQTASSKKKGKPPGMHSHAVDIPTTSSSRDALYESTTVLETLQVRAMRFDYLGRVEEGGEPIQSFENLTDSGDSFELISEPNSQNEIDSAPGDAPSRPIGDLYAFCAEFMLQAAQPDPGDLQVPDKVFNAKWFLCVPDFVD